MVSGVVRFSHLNQCSAQLDFRVSRILRLALSHCAVLACEPRSVPGVYQGFNKCGMNEQMNEGLHLIDLAIPGKESNSFQTVVFRDDSNQSGLGLGHVFVRVG